MFLQGNIINENGIKQMICSRKLCGINVSYLLQMQEMRKLLIPLSITIVMILMVTSSNISSTIRQLISSIIDDIVSVCYFCYFLQSNFRNARQYFSFARMSLYRYTSSRFIIPSTEWWNIRSHRLFLHAMTDVRAPAMESTRGFSRPEYG